MDDAATHIGPLAQAIMKFGRNVLEVGVGWYSTPLIYGMCPKLWCRSVETHRQWANALQPIAGDSLIFGRSIVEEVEKVRPLRSWNVVFIDCYEGSDRVAVARMFLDQPCCIVGHDTERPYWDELLKEVKYVKRFELLTPETAWFSNALDVTV